MAKLIKLSNVSWKQPFQDRKKELHLWSSQPDVAKFCKLEDGTRRLLNIKFEDKFNINITDYFQITSGQEISFPKYLRDKIKNVVFKNPTSFFTVSVLDYEDILFSPSNILWLKNVKRNQGEGWAYEDVGLNRTFLLNWPTAKKNSAGTPNVGDIILLFQKPNKINGKRNYKVHLTHLVSPVSEEIIPDEDSPKHKWCREVRLIAKPGFINAIPNPGNFIFFLANRGLTNPIKNLESRDELTINETQNQIWDLFQNYIIRNPEEYNLSSEEPVGFFGGLEGDKIIVDHVKQEFTRRNASIVKRAKQEALKKGNGRIYCESCNIDFLQKYGEHGAGFIECHHIVHLSEGERITKISDLALVCSNCHRMLHRKNKEGEYYSVEQLTEIISILNP